MDDQELGKWAAKRVGDAIRDIVKQFEELPNESLDAFFREMLVNQDVDERGDCTSAMAHYAEVFRVNEIRIRDETWPSGMVPAEAYDRDAPTLQSEVARINASFDEEIEYKWETYRHIGGTDDQVPNALLEIVSLISNAIDEELAMRFAVLMSFFEISWEDSQLWDKYEERHNIANP